ncbi:MAG TPA: hypothetical protein VL992_06415 [Tepidisphaeraceae bacterium]|nr:hypothetical protein [Tepidisphaeraceae bacterium]
MPRLTQSRVPSYRPAVQETIEDRGGRRHVAHQFAPILQRSVAG